MIVLLALLTFARAMTVHAPVFAPSLRCAFELAPVSTDSETYLADFVTLPSGQEVFLRIEHNPIVVPHKYFLLLHGLLETHRSYDAVAARLVQQGYGVVRPDLPGFGRTLLRQIQNAEKQGGIFYGGSVLDYTSQVGVILEILRYLRDVHGIVAPDIVGHSMGGALALATAANPEGALLTGPRVTGIAPYIYRLDYDALENMMYLGFEPLVRLNSMSNLIPSAFKNGWMERAVSEPHLRQGLNTYFEKILARELNVGVEDRAHIRRRFVTSAIAAKRGLDDFDGYKILAGLPADKRYDLIFGEHDQLIRKGLALQFGARVRKRGGNVRGLNSDHDLLEKQPDAIVDEITGR